jgi:3-hydroxy-9,10-secoandrosta-1,3,5(10)-triene-9,17-dione monooxygenase
MLKNPIERSPYDVSPQQDEFVKRAEAMVARLKSRVAETDRLAKLPDATVRELMQEGLLTLCLPHRYGGGEVSLPVFMQAVSELARGDASAAWVAAILNGCTWIACTLYPKSVTDRIFSSPESLVAGVVTPRSCKVRRAAGGYMIEDGMWSFNSGALQATWDLLGIPIVNDAGEMVDQGLALIPMQELEKLNDWDTVGLRGTGSISVKARNVFVPDAHVASLSAALAGDYPEDRASDDPLYQAGFVPVLAGLITFPALGIGQAALDTFMEKLPSRPITYSCYPRQAEAPITHLQVAEASAKIDAARLIVKHAFDEIGRAAASGEKLDFLSRARMRRDFGFVFRLIFEAVDLLASAGGGSLAHSGNLLNRLWRDAKIAGMHGIACTSSNFELFGRIFCGQPANDPLV